MKQELGTGRMVGREVAGASVRRVELGVQRGEGVRSRSLLGLALGVALVGMLAGCHKTPAQSTTAAQVDQDPGDPADANMAPVNGTQPAAVLGENDQYQPQQQGEEYTQQQAAPIVRQAADGGTYSAQGDANYSAQNSDQGNGNGQYDTQQAEDAYAADLTDAEANDPPPPLPEYDQPPAPDPNYLWTPGYWGWADGGYYWVPGCWVAAPYAGALWTPGYWGYVGNRYRFHHGFWGLHIGFYGGVNYGYGYTGYGYYGGYWNSGHFYYNTSVNRVDVNRIHNVYRHTVVIDHRTYDGGSVNRVSFNGGHGGIQVRPRAAEVVVMQEQRHAPMASQVQVQHQASQNRAQFYSQNKGRPAVAVNARPVVADRMPPAMLPRVAAPMMRPAAPANRPGNQMQGGNHGVQQGQPQSQMRPALPQAQEHNGQQRNGPAAVQTQGTHTVQQPPQQQPQRQQQQQQQREQQQLHENNAAPQSQFRPGVQQPQPQQQRGAQPEARQPQPNMQARPQSETRPAAPMQQRPQEQARPQQQAPQQRPQQQARPQEQMRPQQQAPQQRPQHMEAPQQHPQEHAAPQPQAHGDDKGHH